VGGAESIPWPLLPWRYPGPLITEALRNVNNFTQTTALGVLRRRARQSNLVLASTRQMLQAFNNLGVAAKLMPPIGLRTSEFVVPRRVVHPGPLRLLYVGNLLALKGLDFALEALKSSGADATLTLVGDGPFRKDLERLVAVLDLKDRVVFRGRLPREQTLGLYRDFDVFLFPSLHDTGGYAVIEAMCNAMPTICLNAGGPAVAVEAGGGICVPLGSRREVMHGLAEAIRSYDQDRERTVRDGLTARHSVERNYDWEHKGKCMNAFYRETVSS
jgi:glycosyltransferase involved in cell wall biosynthesis